MRIVHIETLLNTGAFSQSSEWKKLRGYILEEIEKIDWPIGSGKFTIYPQSGKKRGEGNGVKHIKDSFVKRLVASGWEAEGSLDFQEKGGPGKLDLLKEITDHRIAIEWETGNISSSHRALNKMALGLLRRILDAGILIVPSRALYKYLTDRVGNFNELQPYVEVWKSLNIQDGILEIIVIEQDDESWDVERIPKGTDGRSLL